MIKSELDRRKNMLGDKLDKLCNVRNEIDALNRDLKELKELRDKLQYSIIEDMTNVGLDTASTANITVTHTTELVPTVDDKTAFVKWCVENDYIDAMIQSRCNSAPFREYVEQHKCYPDGLDGYIKDKLNVRRL